LRAARASDFADARFDSPKELTVNGTSGIYVVKAGAGFAVVRASDNAPAIETALETLPGIGSGN
jgi:hypothetical protein